MSVSCEKLNTVRYIRRSFFFQTDLLYVKAAEKYRWPTISCLLQVEREIPSSSQTKKIKYQNINGTQQAKLPIGPLPVKKRSKEHRLVYSSKKQLGINFSRKDQMIFFLLGNHRTRFALQLSVRDRTAETVTPCHVRTNMHSRPPETLNSQQGTEHNNRRCNTSCKTYTRIHKHPNDVILGNIPQNLDVQSR